MTRPAGDEIRAAAVGKLGERDATMLRSESAGCGLESHTTWDLTSRVRPRSVPTLPGHLSCLRHRRRCYGEPWPRRLRHPPGVELAPVVEHAAALADVRDVAWLRSGSEPASPERRDSRRPRPRRATESPCHRPQRRARQRAARSTRPPRVRTRPRGGRSRRRRRSLGPDHELVVGADAVLIPEVRPQNGHSGFISETSVLTGVPRFDCSSPHGHSHAAASASVIKKVPPFGQSCRCPQPRSRSVDTERRIAVPARGPQGARSRAVPLLSVFIPHTSHPFAVRDCAIFRT